MVQSLEETYLGGWWPYWTWTNLLLLSNAVVGLLIFEWTWFRTRRFRTPIVELNAQFPELSRNDAPQWRKWKLYPGALTILLPRFIAIVVLMVVMAVLLNIWLVGQDRSQPLSVVRKYLCQFTTKICINLIGLVCFFTYFDHEYMQLEAVGFYEEYLGPFDEQRRY